MIVTSSYFISFKKKAEKVFIWKERFVPVFVCINCAKQEQIVHEVVEDEVRHQPEAEHSLYNRQVPNRNYVSKKQSSFSFAA